MSFRVFRAAMLSSLAVSGLVWMTGCASGSGQTDETKHADAVKATDATARAIGQYPAPPDTAKHPRVGVKPFTVSTVNGERMAELDDVAADEATTLMDQWGGFQMIERAQLDQLYNEQGLAGVKAGEEAKQQQIHGVDYILIGKVTNLSIKRETTKHGWSFGGIGQNGSDTKITSTCGVVLRLVDPASGAIVGSINDDYDQVFSASQGGFSIAGMSTGGGSDVQVSDDDRAKLLKMALDDAINKGIPKFTKILMDYNARATAPVAPAAPAAPADAPVPTPNGG